MYAVYFKQAVAKAVLAVGDTFNSDFQCAVAYQRYIRLATWSKFEAKTGQDTIAAGAKIQVDFSPFTRIKKNYPRNYQIKEVTL